MHENTRRWLRHTLLLTAMVVSAPAAAQETGDTGDTGVTTPAVDTGTPGVVTTVTGTTEPVIEFCTTCSSAADLAGEQGGNPCGEGCATTGGAAVSWLWLPFVALVVHRRSGADEIRRSL